jgi:large repetitive protein
LDGEKLNVPVTPGTTMTLNPVTLLGGDTNDDCDINVLDLSLVGGRFGLSCGDTNWDDRADINADCTVDILDLSLLGSNFGKTCPVTWN